MFPVTVSSHSYCCDIGLFVRVELAQLFYLIFCMYGYTKCDEKGTGGGGSLVRLETLQTVALLVTSQFGALKNILNGNASQHLTLEAFHDVTEFCL